MWWNILPPFFIIAASIALPQFISPLTNWLFVGNIYRRSLLDPDLRKQYMRDTRLTGNPYILTSLEDVPEDDEEPELTEEQIADAEYQRCKAMVEDKQVQEALDRTTKCPRPDIEDEEEQKKSKGRALKKKRQKRKVVPVVETLDTQEKCRKRAEAKEAEKKDLCNVGPVCPPCPQPGEDNNAGGVVMAEEDPQDKPKKCTKKEKSSKDPEVSHVVVPVTTKAEVHDEPTPQKQCERHEPNKNHEISKKDNLIVVKDNGKKKCKSKVSSSGAVVDVPQEGSTEERNKCPKKEAYGEEDKHLNAAAVVGGKQKTKKCAKKDEGNALASGALMDDENKSKCVKKDEGNVVRGVGVVSDDHKPKKCAKKDEGHLVGGGGVADDDQKNKKCPKKE